MILADTQRNWRSYETRAGKNPVRLENGGVAATCPFCNNQNEAHPGPNGTLDTHPNHQTGVWCAHALGCYPNPWNPGSYDFLFR